MPAKGRKAFPPQARYNWSASARSRKVAGFSKKRPCAMRIEHDPEKSADFSEGHASRDRNGSDPMNKPLSENDLATPKVTTGRSPAPAKSTRSRMPPPTYAYRCARSRSTPPPASRRCPSTIPPVPTPTTTWVSMSRPASSAPRVEWVKERGGVEEYEGRPIQPVDNGNVTGKHLARNFPNTPKPMRAPGGRAGHAI